MLPCEPQLVILFVAIAVIVFFVYLLVRLRLQPILKRARMYRPVSPPVIVLAVCLTSLISCAWGLWTLGLLRVIVEGALFQAITFFLAAAAITFAFIQFWDSRDHGSKIRELLLSMSTRYIGKFPKDMDDIIDVVKRADRELWIMADFVDYGSYSKPETSDRLIAELNRARERGVCVRFLVYGKDPADEILRSQFKADDFEKTRGTPEFAHYFRKKYPGITEPQDYAEFLNVLSRKQQEFTNTLEDKGVNIQPLPRKVWLFFWLEDEEDAVFVFEDIGAHGQGLAFRTRDAKLIETFHAIFKRTWEEVCPPKAAKPAQSGAEA